MVAYSPVLSKPYHLSLLSAINGLSVAAGRLYSLPSFKGTTQGNLIGIF